jgi:transcriptional regulator with XRE-family HTH domain
MPRGLTATQRQRARALGAEIAQLRADRGLSLRALAAKLPMSPSNLGRIERGEQAPPPEELIVLIARALGSDPARLLRLAGRLPEEEAVSLEQGILRALGEVAARLDAMQEILHGDLQRIENAIVDKRSQR